MLGGQRAPVQAAAEMIHIVTLMAARCRRLRREDDVDARTTTPMPTPRTGRRKPTPRARRRVARERARGVAASAARPGRRVTTQLARLGAYNPRRATSTV